MDNQQYRLIDANFNRSREAFRVMEDYARFLLDDAYLSEKAKVLRHSLSQVMAIISSDKLIVARDTKGDVGTKISTGSENIRTDSIAVLQAAAKRLSESLRSLEEYAKIVNTDVAGLIEGLRYNGYELEKLLLTRALRNKAIPDKSVYALLSRELCRGDIIQVARDVLAGGADCIQLREKDITDRDYLSLARELSNLCHDAGCLFFVNDRVDIALMAGADGVHIGQEDLPIRQIRKIVPVSNESFMIGVSTHNMDQVKQAMEDQPDYIAIGAIYPSDTKPDVASVGLEMLSSIAGLTSIPIVAIGGINSGRAREVALAGASAIAVCQGIISSESPSLAVKEFKAAMV